MKPIIYQQLEKEIVSYLTPLKKLYENQLFDFKVETIWDFSAIEVTGYCKDSYRPEEKMDFILLRVLINYTDEQVYIPNIFLQPFMRYSGLGKKLIYEIFQVTEKEGYGLFITDMVPSFYNKMLNRGALPCNEADDVVMITRETKLIDNII